MEPQDKKTVAFFALLFPLLLAASLTGHHIGYVLSDPNVSQRLVYLQETGHRYLSELPLMVCLLIVLFAVVLIFMQWSWQAAGIALHGRGMRRICMFFPAGFFLLQELFERWISSGTLPLEFLCEKQVLFGLCAQVPFGYFAYLLAILTLSLKCNLRNRVLLQEKLFSELPIRTQKIYWIVGAVLFFARVLFYGASRAPPSLSCFNLRCRSA